MKPRVVLILLCLLFPACDKLRLDATKLHLPDSVCAVECKPQEEGTAGLLVVARYECGGRNIGLRQNDVCPCPAGETATKCVISIGGVR